MIEFLLMSAGNLFRKEQISEREVVAGLHPILLERIGIVRAIENTNTIALHHAISIAMRDPSAIWSAIFKFTWLLL